MRRPRSTHLPLPCRPWTRRSDTLPRILAFYLPQYHPIPENDEWWGQGFTEWRNVARATPRFPGHYQPHLPGELGFYDLRLPEVREAQAELARQHGIDGFVLLPLLVRRPAAPRAARSTRCLASGAPNFPFCLCWANENWTRAWDGGDDAGAHRPALRRRKTTCAHLRALAPALADDRYVRVDGRPLLLVYRPTLLPDPRRMSDTWRAEARRLGIGELYLCRVENFAAERGDPTELGLRCRRRVPTRSARAAAGALPGAVAPRVQQVPAARRTPGGSTPTTTTPRWRRWPCAKPRPGYPWYRCVMPGWDNTARRETGAYAFLGSTPDLYERWLTAILTEETARGSDADRWCS